MTPAEHADFVRHGVAIRRRFVDADRLEVIRLLIDEADETKGNRSLIEAQTQTRQFTGTRSSAIRGSSPCPTSQAFAPWRSRCCSRTSRNRSVPRRCRFRLPGNEQPVKSMHVDGVSCPHLDPTELRTFTLLIGILVTDVESVDGGALRYVPGGHLEMAEWFRSHWTIGHGDQAPPGSPSKSGFPLRAIEATSS